PSFKCFNLLDPPPFIKAGVCPWLVGTPISNSISICNFDNDCKDAMKCCPTLIGRYCLQPDANASKTMGNERKYVSGRCPDGSLAVRTCTTDANCGNAQTCFRGVCCPKSGNDGNPPAPSVPGNCPTMVLPSPSFVVQNNNLCENDGNCSSGRKCCPTLLGKRCLLPS
ncbi:WAP domain containing protein, SLPI-like, partial [Trichuris trichiura]